MWLVGVLQMTKDMEAQGLPVLEKVKAVAVAPVKVEAVQ